MKKVVFSLIFSCWIIASFSQKITGNSNQFSFQANLEKSKISGVSKMLVFNAASAMPKLSATSDVFYFGTSKREVKLESQTAKVELPATPQQSVAQSTLISISTESKVAESKIKAVQNLTELGEEYAVKPPTYRALILGVSDYQFAGNGLVSLANPSSDAHALYNVLTQRYLFDSANVKYLKNPTRQQIIDTFEELSSEVTENENLLVFYAGHGFYDKEKELGYWLPADAKLTSKSNWIPNSTIKDYLSSIKAKHTLLITDACFGGSIFKTRAVDANTAIRIHELYRDPSRKAITSGNLTEVPDQSPFIEFLLKKLNENEEDFLPTQKLFSRIFEPISNNSSATPQFGVIQGAGDQGGDFIFIKRK